jgi:hypothetical protein
MSTTSTSKIENKNNSKNDKDLTAQVVIHALRINEAQSSVIYAVADNLGEDVITFLATAVRAHVEGLLDCPEAVGAAFAERQLAVWRASNPDA